MGVDSSGYAIVNDGKPLLLKTEKLNKYNPLSLSLIKEAFMYEYRRRYDEHVSSGKKVDKIIVSPLK